jgi:signal transduction histidine kinase
LSPATQEAAYRIAQEALHNALRHADAEQIDVELATRGGGLRLTVRDNGRGFATAVPDAAGRRLGLSSMRERAQAAGGRLQVRSTPGTGTTIQLEVPAGG